MDFDLIKNIAGGIVLGVVALIVLCLVVLNLFDIYKARNEPDFHENLRKIGLMIGVVILVIIMIIIVLWGITNGLLFPTLTK